MKSITILILTLLVFLSGCGYGSAPWYRGQMEETDSEAKVNNGKILKLNIGNSKAEVLAITGMPSKRESYRLENEKIIDFLFYRTSGWKWSDDGNQDYQFTPFAFENDKLTGWGRNFYDNVIRHAVEIQLNR